MRLALNATLTVIHVPDRELAQFVLLTTGFSTESVLANVPMQPMLVTQLVLTVPPTACHVPGPNNVAPALPVSTSTPKLVLVLLVLQGVPPVPLPTCVPLAKPLISLILTNATKPAQLVPSQFNLTQPVLPASSTVPPVPVQLLARTVPQTISSHLVYVLAVLQIVKMPLALTMSVVKLVILDSICTLLMANVSPPAPMDIIPTIKFVQPAKEYALLAHQALPALTVFKDML